MKINKLKCNGEIAKLKNKGYTHTTSKMTYNSKSDSDFNKSKLECEQGTQYFYKSKTSPTSDCNPLDKKYTDKGYTMTLDVERYRKAKNKGTYDVAYYLCKSDNKNHYFYKTKGVVTVDPVVVTPGGRYRDCTGGPYNKGCTDTEGIIRKVQCFCQNCS